MYKGVKKKQKKCTYNATPTAEENM